MARKGPKLVAILRALAECTTFNIDEEGKAHGVLMPLVAGGEAAGALRKAIIYMNPLELGQLLKVGDQVRISIELVTEEDSEKSDKEPEKPATTVAAPAAIGGTTGEVGVGLGNGEAVVEPPAGGGIETTKTAEGKTEA